MLLLIVSSLLLVFICAWILSQPFRVNRSEQEARAQQGQYALARERLLQQLEQIDVQAAEGLLERESAKSEIARLEYELAGILKQLDAGSDAGAQASANNATKLNSWLACSGFSLFLLIGSFVLYGSWQADTLLSLLNSDAAHVSSPMPIRQQTTPMPKTDRSSITVPPEALAMVSRLEGKLAKNPDDGDGWKRLGRSYMVMGRYQEAVSAYSSSAELLPNDGQIKLALQQLAEIASRGGRHPQGADEQQAQAAHPKMPDDSLQRIIQLEEKVATGPDDAMSWARLGRAYLNIQRDTDAKRAYAEAYALEPENTVILATYAGLVFDANPRDPEGQALELFKQLHVLDAEHPDGLWFLGLAAYSEGNLGRTIELWTKLLGVLPPGSEGYASVRSSLSKVEALSNTGK